MRHLNKIDLLLLQSLGISQSNRTDAGTPTVEQLKNSFDPALLARALMEITQLGQEQTVIDKLFADHDTLLLELMVINGTLSMEEAQSPYTPGQEEAMSYIRIDENLRSNMLMLGAWDARIADHFVSKSNDQRASGCAISMFYLTWKMLIELGYASNDEEAIELTLREAATRFPEIDQTMLAVHINDAVEAVVQHMGF